MFKKAKTSGVNDIYIHPHKLDVDKSYVIKESNK